MLQVKNLKKSYGSKVALKDFSYTFEDRIYGMLGANGAGKSTLMNLLTDNVKRDSGNILYDGKEILSMGSAYRELIGYMPQQQGFYENFSARMFLFYMAELKGINVVNDAAARVHIRINNFLAVDSIGGFGRIVDEKTFVLQLQRSGEGTWKVRMEGPLQNGK